MIVLDTNVVSEGLRPHRDSNVANWLNRRYPETLFLTAVSLAELLLGVELLPVGRRKNDLAAKLDAGLLSLFGPRVLSFDHDAAIAYAALVGRARKRGVAISVPDGQIAAIALARGFAVATRDIEPFRAAGVDIVNPWDASA